MIMFKVLQIYFKYLQVLFHIFTKNYFFNNTNHALDDGDGFINHWDNGTDGNWWQNYTEKDLDDDGIGDVAWQIPGLGGFYDDFPIWEDGKDLNPYPNISSPDDISYFYAHLGNNITWDASPNASGVYFYRMQAGTFTDVKRLTVVR